MIRRLQSIGIGLLILSGVQVAVAQGRPATKKAVTATKSPPPKTAPVAANNTPKYEKTTGPGGIKTIVIKEAVRVEGRIAKPEALYVLPPSTLGYAWENLSQSFLPQIPNAVNKNPF